MDATQNHQHQQRQANGPAARHPRFIEPLNELAALRAGVVGEGPLPPFYFETRDALGRQNSFRFDTRLMRAAANGATTAAAATADDLTAPRVVRRFGGRHGDQPRWLRINTDSGVPTPPDSDIEEDAMDHEERVRAFRRDLENLRQVLDSAVPEVRSLRRRREAEDEASNSDSDIEIVLNNPEPQLARRHRVARTRNRTRLGQSAATPPLGRSYHWPPTPYISAHHFDDEEDYFAHAFSGMRITPPNEEEEADEADDEMDDDISNEDEHLRESVIPRAEQLDGSFSNTTTHHADIDSSRAVMPAERPPDLRQTIVRVIEFDDSGIPVDASILPSGDNPDSGTESSRGSYWPYTEDEDGVESQTDHEDEGIGEDRQRFINDFAVDDEVIDSDQDSASESDAIEHQDVEYLPLAAFPTPTLDATSFFQPDNDDLPPWQPMTRSLPRPDLLDDSFNYSAQDPATVTSSGASVFYLNEIESDASMESLTSASSPSTSSDLRARYDFSSLDDAPVADLFRPDTSPVHSQRDEIIAADDDDENDEDPRERLLPMRGHMVRARDGHLVSPYPISHGAFRLDLQCTKVTDDRGAISVQEEPEDYFSSR